MNNKGFSLVELLAVIIILGLISIITVPTIINKYNENKEKQYNQLVSSLESSAKIYTENHIDILNNVTTQGTKITIEMLIKEELISANTKDPKTGEVLNKNSYVIVKLVNDKIVYQYVEV